MEMNPAYMKDRRWGKEDTVADKSVVVIAQEQIAARGLAAVADVHWVDWGRSGMWAVSCMVVVVVETEADGIAQAMAVMVHSCPDAVVWVERLRLECFGNRMHLDRRHETVLVFERVGMMAYIGRFAVLVELAVDSHDLVVRGKRGLRAVLLVCRRYLDNCSLAAVDRAHIVVAFAG